MEFKDVLGMDISDKSVLIIGCPGSGKTWLCNKMLQSQHTVIHTDKYKSEGYEMGMYSALNAWCQIRWAAGGNPKIINERGSDGHFDFSKIFITPIPPNQLKEQASVMLEQVKINETHYDKEGYDIEHYKKTGELHFKVHGQ